MCLKTGNLIFYKGKSLISKEIENDTCSNYSHGAIVVGAYLLAECDWKFPLKINLLSYNSKDFDVYEIPNLTNVQIEIINEFIQSTLNTKYDFIAVLSYFLHKHLGLKFIQDPTKYYCFEHIWDCLEMCGLIPIYKKDDFEIIGANELIQAFGLKKVVKEMNGLSFKSFSKNCSAPCS